MINGKLLVEKLIAYARNFLYLNEVDEVYTRNLLLGQFNLTSPWQEGGVDYDEIANMQVPDVLFEEVMAYALENGLCEDGDEEIACTFEEAYEFSCGLSLVKISGKYGYIDSTFKHYSFEYEDATSFYNGVAAVKKDGKWGLINREFKAITSFEYDDVVRDDANICSRKGVIFMLKGQSYHMIDMDGKKITNDTFAGAQLFYSDYAAVKKGDKWGFIDRDGKTVIDFKFDEASSFASGIAAVKQGEQWGCIDKNGKVLLDSDYGHAMITSDNGVVVLKVGELYRFVQFIKFD